MIARALEWLRQFRYERCGPRAWILAYPGGWFEISRLVEAEEREHMEALNAELLQPCMMARAVREAEGRCGWCGGSPRGACRCEEPAPGYFPGVVRGEP